VSSDRTIVLAEVHGVIRSALRHLLDAQKGLRVVADASDGLQAVRYVERFKPDVLVLDLVLPSLPGLEVMRRAAEVSPRTKSVVLTVHSEYAYVQAAFAGGACAYVLKEASGSDLGRAIREALAGRRFLSPPLDERALAEYARRAKGLTDLDAYETLTDREREVFHLVAEGQSSTTIAWKLKISPRTAEAHRARVMRKLGARNRTELIRYAVRRGLVPPERGADPGPPA
jgi:DNA-binding NarL/FixJ family response regulator